MKVIGIFGKSGVGKTTLSKLMQSYDAENIEIIHLDNLYDEIKKKFFRRNLTEQTDMDNNEIVTVNPHLKNKLLESKIVGFIMRRRNILGNILIKKKISQARRLGKKAIIIEGIHLNSFKVMRDADAIIRVEAPFAKRLNRVRKREDKSVDKKKMVFLDKVFFLGEKRRYNYYIENDDNIKKLEAHVKQIYNAEIKTREETRTLKEIFGEYEVNRSSIALDRSQRSVKMPTVTANKKCDKEIE